ncbi:hypothetical protein [Aquitalea magnusonii]|uniref:hypothetical protein n=1 Tax=Aquitalea magnusonii TaxID=332411 RepID=UPI000B5D04CE|nr:hypothetical protein [Aquitalea magnusonii]
MLDKIIAAINDRKVISLNYDGLDRLIEPHAVGVSSAGNVALLCFQIAGDHTTAGHDWNLFTLSKITNLDVTDSNFESPQPGYKRGDRGMTKIYAEL